MSVQRTDGCADDGRRSQTCRRTSNGTGRGTALERACGGSLPCRGYRERSHEMGVRYRGLSCTPRSSSRAWRAGVRGCSAGSTGASARHLQDVHRVKPHRASHVERTQMAAMHPHADRRRGHTDHSRRLESRNRSPHQDGRDTRSRRCAPCPRCRLAGCPFYVATAVQDLTGRIGAGPLKVTTGDPLTQCRGDNADLTRSATCGKQLVRVAPVVLIPHRR